MNRKERRYAALLLIGCSIFSSATAQFMPFPGMGMGMGGFQIPNNLNPPVDTAVLKKGTQQQANQDQNAKPEKPKSKTELAIDTMGQSVKKDELTLKRMNIAASRMSWKKNWKN